MDIVGGLTAAKLALDLAKDLRSIDKSVDEATYKMKLAELMSALADARLALSDAKTKQSELEEKIATLEQGNKCPICLTGRLKVVNVERIDMSPSREIHTCTCSSDECSYESIRRFNASMGKYEGA